MKITRYLLAFFFSLAGFAGYAVQSDSTEVNWRKVTPGTISRVSEMEELNYPVEVGESQGIMQSILKALSNVLIWLYGKLAGGILGMDTINWIFLIAALVMLYLFWRLFKSKYDWIFSSRRNSVNIAYDVEGENIHEIDYENEIATAVAGGDFRLAVRLLYLRTLKLLADNNRIVLADGKTNNEYLRETKGTNFGDRFLNLSFHFNYLWYGHFDANKDRFEAAQSEYQRIKQIIEK